MYSLSAVLSVFAFSPLILANDLAIVTSKGLVEGIALASGVHQWLSIPFAASTGGENRWMPPQPAPVFNGTFRATSFGDTCFQDLNAANEEFLVLTRQSAPVPTSEDCLSLNIWAPPTSRSQNNAVMIWIYGGSMEFGTVCKESSSFLLDILTSFRAILMFTAARTL
jgi:carboxylesterase type B